VLAGAARAIFTSLATGVGDPVALGERLGQAIDAGHLQLFSTNSRTQSMLATTQIAQALPTKSAPLLGVFTQDANADKLTYYLRRSIAYQVVPAPQLLDFGDGGGPRPQEQAVVSVRLDNLAPATGLPAYVAPGQDAATGQRIEPGSMRLAVSVYLAKFGVVSQATVDGSAVAFNSETEQGLSVVTVVVTLPPGGSRTIQLRVRQPATPGAPLHLLSQPSVLPDIVTTGGREVRTSSTLK
jgi:hypothetical protein